MVFPILFSQFLYVLMNEFYISTTQSKIFTSLHKKVRKKATLNWWLDLIIYFAFSPAKLRMFHGLLKCGWKKKSTYASSSTVILF